MTSLLHISSTRSLPKVPKSAYALQFQEIGHMEGSGIEGNGRAAMNNNVLEQIMMPAGANLDLDAPNHRRKRRHSYQQIEALERFFSECSHPNESQRLVLSEELGLTPCQVKFWFQNKRTHIKNQTERSEKERLSEELEKLMAENRRLEDAFAKSFCANCGNSCGFILGDMTLHRGKQQMNSFAFDDQLVESPPTFSNPILEAVRSTIQTWHQFQARLFRLDCQGARMAIDQLQALACFLTSCLIKVMLPDGSLIYF